MSGPRGIHLSGTQVIASVLATLTGAIAASYLGVAGTLIGAALGSIASTMGTEVYRHYLLRSQQGLKSAGEMLYQRSTGAHTAAQPSAAEHPASQPSGPPASGRRLAQPGQEQETVTWRQPYPAETGPIPELAALRRNGQTARWADGGGPDGRPGPGGSASTRAGGQVGGGEPGSGAPVAGPGPGRGGHWWDRISRRQWLVYGGIMAGAFVVVIAAITVFELSVGKPVNALVWGKHGSGTTVGNVVGGHSSPNRARHPGPTGRPSAQPSSAGSPSPAGSSSPSSPAPTPTTSGPVTPTPTPTTSGPSSPANGTRSVPPATSP